MVESKLFLTQDELCLVPEQISGEAWVEISFLTPYYLECLSEEKKQSSTDLKKCSGVFVFVGDPNSLAMSFKFSAYQPRWTSGVLGFYIPTLLEKVLSWTLHISASFALCNSLPLFFLDGESILEIFVLNLTFLRPRTRQRIMRILLYGGTILFIFSSLRAIFHSIFLKKPP